MPEPPAWVGEMPETLTLERSLAEELIKWLREELAFYKAVIARFERKYNCTLEELEARIEREGVPVDEHEIWEDSIEWRNALEEVKRIKRILRGLST